MCISRACSRAKTTETGAIQDCAVCRRRRFGLPGCPTPVRADVARRQAISDGSVVVWRKLGPPIEGGCAHLTRPNGSGRPQLHPAHLPFGPSRQTTTSAMESAVEHVLPQGIWPRKSTVRSHTRGAAISGRNRTGVHPEDSRRKSDMFPPHGTPTYVHALVGPTAKPRRPE